MQSKFIEVVPYNPAWPQMFEVEAENIRKALGDNCIAVHHVGSTSVPGLSAKPTIDILAVVKSAQTSIPNFESIGYTYKGEMNIPFRFYFNKNLENKINLHVYEEGSTEIELNLLFRDYLRAHPDARAEYSNLKAKLLKQKGAQEKTNSKFVGYTLGKDEFIKNILNKSGFNKLRLMHCTHYAEWETAKHFRQKYFFGKVPIADPYTYTFDRDDHTHFVLYQGTRIIGYAHIQLWPGYRAALRIIVVDELDRNKGFGGQFLALIEKWLKFSRYKILHLEAPPAALQFYKQRGYTEMEFNDPENHESDPRDTPIGKIL